MEEFNNIEDILKEMEGEDSEDVQILTAAQEVHQTINTEGWKTIKEEVSIEMRRLEERISLTASMEECYGCTKALSGMKFVFDSVENIIEEGNLAVARLKQGDLTPD